MPTFDSEGARTARRNANRELAHVTHYLTHPDPTRRVEPLESTGAREARRQANASTATVTRILLERAQAKDQ